MSGFWLQRGIALVSSAMVSAGLIANLVAGKHQDALIYGAGCTWWAIFWVVIERHNR